MSRRLIDGKQPVPRPGANKGGRPAILELDPAILERAESALRMGASIQSAFGISNIAYDTLRDWVIKGHEDPNSIYGALIKRIYKACAEWEVRDVSVIDQHALGRPAEYEKEVVRDSDGSVVKGADGLPVMQVARDADGNPIVRRKAIESDWRAAAERLARRKPKYWSKRELSADVDAILTFDNKQPETKEALSFEERVAQAYKKMQEDV